MNSITPASNISNTPIYSVSENAYEILRMKKDMGVEIIDNIKDILQEDDINFTGDLSTSFKLIFSQNDIWIESDNVYANIVDKGMSPGTWVDFDALSDWVRIKLNIPDEMVNEVTWKILYKIRRHGLEPKYYVKKAIKRFIGKRGMLKIKSSPKTSNTRKRDNGILKSINTKIKYIKRTLRKIDKILKPINNIKSSKKYTRSHK